MTSVGERSGGYHAYMSSSISIETGRQLVVELLDSALELATVADFFEHELDRLGEPTIDRYLDAVSQFDGAFFIENLELASRLQLELLRLVDTNDFARWKASLIGAYSHRDATFVASRGQRVAALYYSDERMRLLERAAEIIDVRRPPTRRQIQRDAQSLQNVRRMLADAGTLRYPELQRALRSAGETRARTLVNWLVENREAWEDGDKVHIGADPHRIHDDPDIPPFRMYFPSRSDMTDEQRQFYDEVFRPRFLAGDPVPLGRNISYGFVLLYELMRNWGEDPEATLRGLELATSAYADSKLGQYAGHWTAEAAFLAGDFRRGLSLLEDSGGLSIDMYLSFAAHEGHPRMSIRDALSWSDSERGLTSFGQENLTEILAIVQSVLDDFHERHGQSIIEDFWRRVAVSRSSGEYPDEIGRELAAVMQPTESQERLRWADDGSELYRDPPRAFSPLRRDLEIEWPVKWAAVYWYTDLIAAKLATLFREAENSVRADRGLPRIGEGWVSELELLLQIRAAFSVENVVHQGRPRWLRPQSLDIYLPDHNVGVEYQGAQHHEPVERFGGADALDRQRERDDRKRSLCRENGCTLIEVLPGYDFEEVVRRIRAGIDAGSHASTSPR